MDPEDDFIEDDFIEDLGPRMEQRRVLHVAPDGSSSSVETGGEFDASQPMPKGPRPPGEEMIAAYERRRGGLVGGYPSRAPEQRRETVAGRDRRDEEHSPIMDFFGGAADLTMGAGATPRVERTGDRLAEIWSDFERDPAGSVGSAGMGALQGVTRGGADQMMAWGVSTFAPEEGSYEDVLPTVRRSFDEARQANPGLGALSREAAAVATSPIAGASSAGGRIAAGVAEGAAAGVGYGDADTYTDAAVNGVIGGAIGGAIGGVFEAHGMIRRAGSRAAGARDRRLLEATGQGLPSDAAAFSGLGPTRAAQAAQHLRDADAIPAIGTHAQTLEQIQARLATATDPAQRRVLEIAERNAARAVEHQPSPLATSGEAMGDAAIGGLMGGAGGASAAAGIRVARRMGERVAPRVRASVAERAFQISQSDAGRLGAFATDIYDAGRRGPQALSTTHFLMSQRYPEYREMAEQIASEEEPEE